MGIDYSNIIKGILDNLERMKRDNIGNRKEREKNKEKRDGGWRGVLIYYFWVIFIFSGVS
jgi:hypothetical protein